MTAADAPAMDLRLATDPQDLRGAQRLRYKVFVEELGGDGPMIDRDARLERDAYDPHCDHLVLIDPSRSVETGDHVVGAYRLLPGDRAQATGGFYSAGEYDLSVLTRSGRRLLELGRSCVHPDYRGGTAMYQLWNGLAAYVAEHGIEVLFGVASFHGREVEPLRAPLSLLHHRHLAPPDLRVRAVPDRFQPMDLMPLGDIDRRTAMLATPALIKAYLRLGGFVGEGAVIDHEFNTTDVCLVLDTARLNPRQLQIYTRGQGGR